MDKKVGGSNPGKNVNLIKSNKELADEKGLGLW